MLKTEKEYFKELVKDQQPWVLTFSYEHGGPSSLFP